LGYPAGPIIDQLSKKGNNKKFDFTYPKVGEFNYSFSGLKTQFLNFIRKNEQKDKNFTKDNIHDICASYQSHLVSYLLKNLEKAIKMHPCKDIALAGGVSANLHLRKEFEKLGKSLGRNTFVPKMSYCTDNAAMIAMSGKFMEEKGVFADLSTSASARIPMN
jgi:N6-L-threonylcarbamoyladenine synthase